MDAEKQNDPHGGKLVDLVVDEERKAVLQEIALSFYDKLGWHRVVGFQTRNPIHRPQIVLQDSAHGVKNRNCGAQGMTAEQVLLLLILCTGRLF